jgi:DNA-binding NarL/FixJ family response regulator
MRDPIIQMTAQGLTVEQIAARFNVSAEEIEGCLTQIQRDLGLCSRVELILFAYSQRSDPGRKPTAA